MSPLAPSKSDLKPSMLKTTKNVGEIGGRCCSSSGEIGKYLGGIITFEETLMKHSTSKGTPLVEEIRNRGVVPGIKTDKGTVKIPGTEDETSTQGLDGLAERSQEYYKQGARFAKWFVFI